MLSGEEQWEQITQVNIPDLGQPPRYMPHLPYPLLTGMLTYKCFENLILLLYLATLFCVKSFLETEERDIDILDYKKV